MRSGELKLFVTLSLSNPRFSMPNPPSFAPFRSRVACVLTTGQSWQFAQYKWSDPKQLFHHGSFRLLPPSFALRVSLTSFVFASWFLLRSFSQGSLLPLVQHRSCSCDQGLERFGSAGGSRRSLRLLYLPFHLVTPPLFPSPLSRLYSRSLIFSRLFVLSPRSIPPNDTWIELWSLSSGERWMGSELLVRRLRGRDDENYTCL